MTNDQWWRSTGALLRLDTGHWSLQLAPRIWEPQPHPATRATSASSNKRRSLQRPTAERPGRVLAPGVPGYGRRQPACHRHSEPTPEKSNQPPAPPPGEIFEYRVVA